MLKILTLTKVKDKPIKYFLYILSGSSCLSYSINRKNTTVDLFDYLKEKNEENKKEELRNTQVTLKYDPTIFPLLSLNKLKLIAKDFITLEFTVKRHIRTLAPYKNIKFTIPTCIFKVQPMLSKKGNNPTVRLYLKKLSKVAAETKYIFDDRETRTMLPWPYGNVYEQGKVCWGSDIRIMDLGTLIENVAKNTTSTHMDVYINMYMQYIYSEFFDSIFNNDLRYIHPVYLISLSDKPTVNAVNKFLLDNYTDEFKNISNPYAYLRRYRKRLTMYIQHERDLIYIDKSMEE